MVFDRAQMGMPRGRLTYVYAYTKSTTIGQHHQLAFPRLPPS